MFLTVLNFPTLSFFFSRHYTVPISFNNKTYMGEELLSTHLKMSVPYGLGILGPETKCLRFKGIAQVFQSLLYWNNDLYCILFIYFLFVNMFQRFGKSACKIHKLLSGQLMLVQG